MLFCASEVAPFAKTGGLADVAGSLPLALERHGVQTLVVTPRYRGIEGNKKRLSENVSVLFVKHEEYYNRASLYGNKQGDYPDNLKRFAYLCETALDSAKKAGFQPDIIHANDWQTALLPVLLKTRYAEDPFFAGARSVMTIHNVVYQGIFPHRQFVDLGLEESLFSPETFEFYGKLNLLKAGIVFADGVTTVSPTYAKEIRTREYGAGLEGVLQQRSGRLRGILNGLDYSVWDPAKDKKIKARYTADDMNGKALCKAELQAACGFESDARIPLFAVVSRLAEQKGIDLLTEIADTFLSESVQLVVLGDGDAVYKTALDNIGRRHPRNSKMFLGFDVHEAHRIYAGADFFLMPSFYEPCGLSQLIGLRYGTLPIVRQTGGLMDTITDVDAQPSQGNGIVFAGRSSEKFLEAVGRARVLFKDTPRFGKIRSRGMKADFSWEKSAVQYVDLYKEMMG